MSGRVGGMVRGAATALTALVLAHNLIFLAGYGAKFSRAMAVTGHDHGWTITVLVSLALALTLLVAASWRIHRLRSQAREIGALRLPGEPDRADFIRRWLLCWLALTLATALLFVLEENIELLRIGAHIPGLVVLVSATYPNAIAIVALVSVGVSLVAALLGWKVRLLIARICAVALDKPTPAAPPLLPSDPFDRRRGSILGRRLAGRAPPMGLAH